MDQTPNQNMILYSWAAELEIRNGKQSFTNWEEALKEKEEEERDSFRDGRHRRLRKLIHTWEISAVL